MVSGSRVCLTSILSDHPHRPSRHFDGALSTAVGLEVMAELMAAEVTDLAGPKGKHNRSRTAMRHGGQDGTAARTAG
jgi:hypothetical protein